jgi:hypothetical protein
LSTSDGRHHLRLPMIEVAPSQLLCDDWSARGAASRRKDELAIDVCLRIGSWSLGMLKIGNVKPLSGGAPLLYSRE